MRFHTIIFIKFIKNYFFYFYKNTVVKPYFKFIDNFSLFLL